MAADAYAPIRQAADQGHPEALAYCAVFAALGEGEPQSWPRALERLGRAAGAGLKAARAQLRLLAGREPGPDGWPGLAAAVDLSPWLTRVAPQRLPGQERVAAATAFLPPPACQWLIARAASRLAPAPVYDEDGGVTYGGNRNNSAFSFELFTLDVVTVLIRAKVAAALAVGPAALEPSQVLHYAPGQTFHPHYDFLEPDKPGQAAQIAAHGQRIATFLVYLNEGYEGGETWFPELGLRYRGRTGNALFFANVDDAGDPDRRMLHAGLPPTSGEKWLLSQWIRDR